MRTNRRLQISEGLKFLEHAQHDRADKGEGKVRDNDGQLAGESHGKPPGFASQVAVTREAGKLFQREKVGLVASSLPLRSRRVPRRG